MGQLTRGVCPCVLLPLLLSGLRREETVIFFHSHNRWTRVGWEVICDFPKRNKVK